MGQLSAADAAALVRVPSQRAARAPDGLGPETFPGRDLEAFAIGSTGVSDLPADEPRPEARSTYGRAA